MVVRLKIDMAVQKIFFFHGHGEDFIPNGEDVIPNGEDAIPNGEDAIPRQSDL